MKNYLKSYVIMAAVISTLWATFMLYAYTSQRSRDTVIGQEMLIHARHAAQQLVEVFNWFEEKQQVFVPSGQSSVPSPPPLAMMQGPDNKQFTMPLPIELASRLENQIQNGINVSFVGNTPLNNKNLPNASTNRAIMNAVATETKDFFEYNSDVNSYRYVRPLTATKSCIVCHNNVEEGGLIGALIVDIDSDLYLDKSRQSNYNLLVYSGIASFIVCILYFLMLLDIWRRQRTQVASSLNAQAIAANMSQEIELVVNNMGSILQELQQDSKDPQKIALLQSLQAINKNLLDTSFKLQAGESKNKQDEEEIFNVEEFFQQCAQIFYPQCVEKSLSLNVEIDRSVPTLLLGNTYYLRQAVGRLLKNSVLYTIKGGVTLRVRSSIDMPARFKAADLNHIPIHLVIEVEDTSIGFVVTDNPRLLESFAKTMNRKSKLTSRPIISLGPINDIAEYLDGSATIIQNSKNGAIFKLAVQVKLVDDPNLDAAHSTENIQPTSTNLDIMDALAPSLRQKISMEEVAKTSALPLSNKPINIILADDIDFPKNYHNIWKKENYHVTHVKTGSQILDLISKPNHGYSIIYLYDIKDMDPYYLATRIRYYEQSADSPVAVVLFASNVIRTDMEVMRFFNISTMEHIDRDPQVLIKITRLVLQTNHNKIFHGAKLFDKTNIDEFSDKLFDMKKAMENAKNDKQLLQSICSMWVRFYSGQIERLDAVVEENDVEDTLRLLRSVKNSASTVSLPMLWVEANRLETMLAAGNEIRFEKLYSIYEKTYEFMKSSFGEQKKQKPNTTKTIDNKVDTLQ